MTDSAIEVLTQAIADYREVIALGQECVVWITGIPEDAPDVQDFELAMKAIREALRLGQERNDEANELRMALEPFAAMHREGSDPHELACQRGVASDMTVLTSGDFERAATVLAKRNIVDL